MLYFDVRPRALPGETVAEWLFRTEKERESGWGVQASNEFAPPKEFMICEWVEFVREGDEIYVHSMDRLSRSLRDLQDVVERLTAKGISVTFVKENLRFDPPATGTDAHRTAYSTLMLQLLGAVGQFERALILERQREGIAIANTKNLYQGRKNTLDKPEIARLIKMAAEGLPKVQIAETLGISRARV